MEGSCSYFVGCICAIFCNFWKDLSPAALTECCSTINQKHEIICDDTKKGYPSTDCNSLLYNVHISIKPSM